MGSDYEERRQRNLDIFDRSSLLLMVNYQHRKYSFQPHFCFTWISVSREIM